MTYKETILFIGQCLSLSLFPDRADLIRRSIRTGKVDWKKVVQVSSSHLVLPALYIRFEKAGLLEDIPPGLVEYMNEITNLNRERNLQIIDQIMELSAILNQYNISPIFLKGSSHLLFNLYDDVAERMIGDIDFLVDEENYLKAAEILTDAGYEPLNRPHPAIIMSLKHYPRLTHENFISAVEIHREVLSPPNDEKFKAELIIRQKEFIKSDCKLFVPSNSHQVVHNVLNIQLNDKAYVNATINLRQLYDLLLLSKFVDLKEALQDYSSNMVDTNLAIASMVFDGLEFSPDEKTLRTKVSIWGILFFWSVPGIIHNIYKTTIYLVSRFLRYVYLPFQAIYRKDVRAGIWIRLSNPKWYMQHLLSYLKYFGIVR